MVAKSTIIFSIILLVTLTIYWRAESMNEDQLSSSDEDFQLRNVLEELFDENYVCHYTFNDLI